MAKPQIATDGVQFLLVENREAYEWDSERNSRSNVRDGIAVVVVAPAWGFEKVSVKIPSQMELLVEEGQDIDPMTVVQFKGLVITPYVSRQGKIAYSATAESAALAKPAPAPAK